MSRATDHPSTLTRRAALAGAVCLPILLTAGLSLPPRTVDPKAPSAIRWPSWVGGDRAGAVMTPAELAARHAGNAKRLRYALRRLARYHAETGRAVS
jgi:hypothetical protein